MTSFSLSPAPPNRRTPSPPILGPCYPWFIFRLYRTTVTIHAADRSLRCLHSLHSLLTHGHVKTLLCPAHFSRTTSNQDTHIFLGPLKFTISYRKPMGATLYLITNPLLLLTTLYRACSNSISRTRKRRPAGRPSLLAPPVANYLDPGSRKPKAGRGNHMPLPTYMYLYRSVPGIRQTTTTPKATTTTTGGEGGSH